MVKKETPKHVKSPSHHMHYSILMTYEESEYINQYFLYM